jgi:hypothetical protein
MKSINKMPDLNHLKEYLEIDSSFSSGLKWIKSYTNRVKPNTNAGWKCVYWRVNFDKKEYAVHRLIYFLEHEIDPFDLDIDHIDGNKYNNTISNLRLATRQLNNANCKSALNSSSKYKGVSYNKRLGKWIGTITKNYKSIYLGCFTSEVDAALAYNKQAKLLFGKYARLNLINELC